MVKYIMDLINTPSIQLTPIQKWILGAIEITFLIPCLVLGFLFWMWISEKIK